MKKTFFLIMALSMPFLFYGQTFETHISLSPLITFGDNENIDGKTAIGFGASIYEYYNLTDNFAIGLGLVYSGSSYKFTREQTGMFLKHDSHFENKVKLYNWALPLLIRMKTQTGWTFKFGYGAMYNAGGKLKVNYIIPGNTGEETSNYEINAEFTEMPESWNGHFTMGIGKMFNLGKTQLLTDIFYVNNSANFSFSHHGPQGAEILYVYDIDPRWFGCSIGIAF